MTFFVSENLTIQLMYLDERSKNKIKQKRRVRLQRRIRSHRRVIIIRALALRLPEPDPAAAAT